MNAKHGYGKEIVVQTKLILPRLRQHLLPRPALANRLEEARHYRLTIVHASTGYGKSTALVSALQRPSQPLYWYSITEGDRDPLLFLLYLIYAFRLHHPDLGDLPLQLVQETGTAPRRYQMIIDALVNDLVSLENGERLLVLDDYHLVNASPQINRIIDRLLAVLPPRFHLIIATRQRPNLSSLTFWRVKGELLEINQRDLAFSSEEIEALFATQYGISPSREQVAQLASETEGWVIALQMIWQGLQSGVAGDLDQILAELPRSLEDLFAYLAQEVLARRPARIRDFLLRTSILGQLEPAVCDHLLDWDKSRSLLKELDEDNLFIVRQGDAYRYHHLFHDFLRRQLEASPQLLELLHGRAADFFEQSGRLEEAIHHWLAAKAYSMAAQLMEKAGEVLLQDGRLGTMTEWVSTLPASLLSDYPQLMIQMGDLSRFSSHFDEALHWYERAQACFMALRDIHGASRALRGQATVYLDTVRPIKAESLLQEALNLVDGQPDREERARLLDLMAENLTNQGKWEDAVHMRRQARELRSEGPDPADLGVRVRLRAGRLDEALAVLERRAAEEQRDAGDFREPRGHRETLLVQSLIYAWQGRAEEALVCARGGIEVGRRLGSPFVEAVGYMRLAHGWQISGHPDGMKRALESYQRAIDLGDRLAVGRTKVEALWGLCRLQGMSGDLVAAEQSAREGIERGSRAGDEWITTHISAMLGASYVVAGRAREAESWLTRSAIGFRACGDTFGLAVTLLWKALLYLHGQSDELAPTLNTLMDLVNRHNYGFLFQRQTLLGPVDPAELTPLLMAGQRAGIPRVTDHLLELGLPQDLSFFPGYTLRVFTLGRFAVYRGAELVQKSEWRREKARQLLQLLLSGPRGGLGRFLLRDEIAVHLWPDADGVSAERQFKVTLNALQQVLEPARPPRANTLFVQRRGSAYGINPAAPIWIDALAFEQLVARGEGASDPAAALDAYRQAVALFQGDFMPDCVYAGWCQDHRTWLRQRYLTAATQAGQLLLQAGDSASLAEAVQIGERILVADDCWEKAYRLLIRAYLRQGQRIQALRTYERCLKVLCDELNVAPEPETLALYPQIHK